MRGCYVDTLMQGAYRDYIEGLYRRLVEQRCPVYSVSSYDERLLQTKRLMLPLSSDGSQVDKVLAAQVFFQSTGLPNTVLAVQAGFRPQPERIGGEEHRQSVVEGTRVSVRVDLGGGRIPKK